MDTIYAEGQRRYVESLSSYARQFVGQMQKPALDHIEGLSPAIAIEQRNSGHTPRSTVGTVTEIYDYFRVLYARLGQPHCPECDVAIGTQTSDQVVDKILDEAEGTKLFLLAPVEVAVGEQYETLWTTLKESGYLRVRVDGQIYELETPPTIDRRRKHDVAVVIDRITVRHNARARIAEAVESALSMGRGVMQVVSPQEGQPEARWHGAHPQPTPGVRTVRPQFRRPLAAQLFVQQFARLVPQLRRPRHPNRRQPRGARARFTTHPPPRRCCCGPHSPANSPSSYSSPSPPTPACHSIRPTSNSPRASAASSCTAPAKSGSAQGLGMRD